MFDWYDAIQWVWRTGSGTLFTISIKGDDLYYQYWDEAAQTTPGEPVKWGKLTQNTHWFYEYTKHQLINFCGPVQPPPSPVIAKIRLMESRWNKFQERKKEEAKKKKNRKVVAKKNKDGSFAGYEYSS